MTTFHSTTFIDRKENQEAHLDVMVTFVSARNHRELSGIGKVYVLPVEQATSEACDCPFKAQGKLLFNKNSGTIGFRFDASFIYTHFWKTLFSGFYFSMDEDWMTTPAIDKSLHLDYPIQVQRGVYQVTISEEGICIWLKDPIWIVKKSFV